jgi:hypothetical protein
VLAAFAASVTRCDMAVSSAHWFHYEVTFAIDDGGEPKGTIVGELTELQDQIAPCNRGRRRGHRKRKTGGPKSMR